MAEKGVVIVTGGSRGIGKAIVCSLVEDGYCVMFTYRDNSEAADEVCQGLDPACVQSMKADVADAAAASLVVSRTVQQFGRLHAVVNNAARTSDVPFMLMKADQWRDCIDTNLSGAFWQTRAALPHIRRNSWGRIINISSITGIRGNAGQVNYGAAKAGLIGMALSLARELGPFGITVNTVAPGYIQTDMTLALTPQFKTRMCKLTPLGRFGAAEEVSGLVTFLMSRQSNFITGQVIAVDGGLGI